MRVETAVPEDLPPEIRQQGPHPTWVRLIEIQKGGRPQKFVSAGLMTKCSRCGKWKHLSQFYSKLKGNIYVALDGPPSERKVAYGLPHAWCRLCQQEGVHSSNQKAKARVAELEELLSTEDADTNGSRGPAYLKNYPSPEEIAVELIKQFGEDADAINQLVAENDVRALWNLYDQLAEQGLVTPVKLKGRDR